MHRGVIVAAALLTAGSAAIQGCMAPQRGPAVPADLQDRAIVSGMPPAIRTWGGELNQAFLGEVVESVHREQEHLKAAGHTGPLPRAEFLALSGGGSDGAFGAGLLCGWSEAGTRPTFKMVTGISTGALSAPFAFLGPKYDPVLREVYTQTSTKDILKSRGALAAINDDALADNQPLRDMLARLLDQAMLDEIAAEYAKGRILVVGTTDLDARRAVLWNVTAIAASKHPNALELVHDILIASAAIPAAFPPVMIDVEVDGKSYQEMHVDGGTMTQVFLYPPSLNMGEMSRSAGATRERRAYIVRNASLQPTWAQVKPRTLAIAGRAVSSLIQMQGFGDLYRIYLDTQRDGIDFNLAFIPAEFKEKSKEAFDREYMSKLFQLAFDLAQKGYPWQKVPPGYAGG